MQAGAGNTMGRTIVLLVATAGLLVPFAGGAVAAQDVLLTALKGDASIQDRAAGSHAELGDAESLQTGDDGNCSVLVDRNAVVELCGHTRVSFGRDAARGNRIVNIESGEVRLVVEPRDAEERIEIHTPAAIATILGTVVYVSVNPETGETRITSSESQVNIRAPEDEECTPRGLTLRPGERECEEGTTIDALEQLVMAPGQAPQKKLLSREQVDQLGGCLLDFHDLAARVDRVPQEGKVTERIVSIDIAEVQLPPVAGGPPAPNADPDKSLEFSIDPDYTAPPDTDDLLDPFDGNNDVLSDPRDELIDCGGIPCDHGNF